jgi:hypothetical protein
MLSEIVDREAKSSTFQGLSMGNNVIDHASYWESVATNEPIKTKK